eukprot:CAMPEP_0115842690 /NCGR_PEP_ID=MMETSP0287-20121206/7929_1 /TAXON_ID=412157 /ORGANISM="Chrysochromulina rotalis, Strain UIO044" /LENGTH=278 /DNA_ID=CAMNT_0003296365 /DNA_START=10 /DNA_END=847 /DNA_ORIENTATION=-
MAPTLARPSSAACFALQATTCARIARPPTCYADVGVDQSGSDVLHPVLGDPPEMGAHVTKVLSLQIDSWTHAQILHMRSLGNAKVNAELEATLPAGVKPDQAKCTPAELESFIRAKYEMGSFKPSGDGVLPVIAAAASGHEAETAKAMSEYVGLLIIRLLRATNLPSMDMLGTTDAFCEFTLGERNAKSKVVRNSLNPSWNETLSINVRSLNETLVLKMLDADRFGKEYIGQALIPLEDLTHDGQPMGFDLTLQQPAARSTGHGASVAVEITYHPLDR